jgi:hypothetical protein
VSSFRHRVFGLELRSEIPLPELPESAHRGAADIRIERGAIDAPDAAPGYSAQAQGTLLTVPQVGRYLIRGGREIMVDPDPKASERNVRLYLLGSALGALLHQRGLLPLHANAIEVGGRAVAFCGHSGAGKSTLAAWFHDRGYPVLTDDVCVTGFDEEGRAQAFPGIPRLRLWAQALEASGRATDDYQRSFDGMDKYDVPALDGAGLEPRALAAVYLLRQGPEHRIDRLSGVTAVDALVSNTYRGAYLAQIGKTGGHLGACVKVAQSVPVFMAERVWGFDRFEEEARRLEAHAAKLVPGA